MIMTDCFVCNCSLEGRNVIISPCGHKYHEVCFNSLRKRSIKCDICNKSILNSLEKSNLTNKLKSFNDFQLHYSQNLVSLNCNDCNIYFNQIENLFSDFYFCPECDFVNCDKVDFNQQYPLRLSHQKRCSKELLVNLFSQKFQFKSDLGVGMRINVLEKMVGWELVPSNFEKFAHFLMKDL